MSTARRSTLRTVAVLAAACVVATAQPAIANAAGQLSNREVAPSSWLHTDSRTPHDSVTTGGTARIGAWRDDSGQHHIGKAYFTFDVAPFAGTAIDSARLRLPEAAANDCTAARATEVWSVAPERPVTWADQPAELTRLTGPAPNNVCVGEWFTWDAGDLVRQAVAEGRTSVVVAVRIGEEHQGDVRFGRVLKTTPRLSVAYNTPPDTPTGLRVGSGLVACRADLVLADERPLASARLSDPDGLYGLDARFAFWSNDDPSTRVEHVAFAGGGYATTSFPAGLVKHGGAYSFAVRGEDGGAVSEWSEPCTFRSDRVAPDKAPTVTSAVYGENGTPPGDGGQGIAADFTFTANGVADVVAFEYSGIGLPYGRVAADRAGGSATVSLTPTASGPVYLSVSGIDAAGLRSPTRNYRFWVKTTEPTVNTPHQPELGRPLTIGLRANQDGATTFHYRIDDGAERTMPVGADGSGQITMTPTDPNKYEYRITVWTTNSDGLRSGARETSVHIDMNTPWFSVDPWNPVIGSPVTLTFEPDASDVASYTYTINSGDPVVVAADADGYARVTYTPMEAGFYDVVVFSTSSDGVDSAPGAWGFSAESGAPDVTSAEYPSGGYGVGGPGVPGTFTFSSRLADVAEYRYTFDGGPEQVVAADPDGTASVVLTPTHARYVRLTVRAVTSGGLVSGETDHSFIVTWFLPEVSPNGGAVPKGTPLEIHLTATLPGATEFSYTVAGGTEAVVPVGADGTAVISIVPPAGYFEVAVWTRTPQGYTSDTARVFYQGV